jgi:hypothetical protein
VPFVCNLEGIQLPRNIAVENLVASALNLIKQICLVIDHEASPPLSGTTIHSVFSVYDEADGESSPDLSLGIQNLRPIPQAFTVVTLVVPYSQRQGPPESLADILPTQERATQSIGYDGRTVLYCQIVPGALTTKI